MELVEVSYWPRPLVVGERVIVTVTAAKRWPAAAHGEAGSVIPAFTLSAEHCSATYTRHQVLSVATLHACRLGKISQPKVMQPF
jgi:hypothetical protein